jgi:hypothetical protein
MFVRPLRSDEEKIIDGVVALMARSVECETWIWSDKDSAFARRYISYSFGEDRISCVVIQETLGVVGWAAAYETSGKLWKTALILYDRDFKGEDDVTVKELLEMELMRAIKAHGGVYEKALYQTTRKTDLTDKLSRN